MRIEFIYSKIAQNKRDYKKDLKIIFIDFYMEIKI